MKLSSSFVITTALSLASVFASPIVDPVELETRATAKPKGIDISHYQANVNFNTVKSKGVSFVYMKATEGTTYKDPSFSTKYSGATKAGLIRGAYHFARPDKSGGAAQAKFFVQHGGGWSPDGITLPGTLDIEYNTHGDTCYGLSHSAMVKWVKDFSTTYHSLTKRYPVIYTTTDWWKRCTGNSAAFSTNNPLWIARYASSIGTLPAGWKFATFWQYADKGPNPGDQDYFNGTPANLKKFAKGG